jgi:condensin complex subunit 2
MDRIIREDLSSSTDKGTNKGGVNFQKASCTIDASIKIYSNRVDDTWSTSYRILENLNRNGREEGGGGGRGRVGGDENENDDDDEGNDGTTGRESLSGGTVKKVKRSKRAVSSTVEKNLNNINLSAQEMAGASPHADPMFHKMSQVFDEGGAKGMLLTNLVGLTQPPWPSLL